VWARRQQLTTSVRGSTAVIASEQVTRITFRISTRIKTGTVITAQDIACVLVAVAKTSWYNLKLTLYLWVATSTF
jgi:hypothetical protein